jgi:hypothetical protein
MLLVLWLGIMRYLPDTRTYPLLARLWWQGAVHSGKDQHQAGNFGSVPIRHGDRMAMIQAMPLILDVIVHRHWKVVEGGMPSQL